MTPPVTVPAVEPASAGHANADAAELAKFSALAHRWWDPDSDLFGPLHRINPLRLDWIDEVVGGLAGKDVLDVGCGGGILSESMAARGARVTGIDLSEKALGVAKLHKLESGAARRLPADRRGRSGARDAGGLRRRDLHGNGRARARPRVDGRRLRALVRPGGTVVLSTINRNPKSYLFAIVGAEYVLNLLPRGTHDWSKFVKPSEMATYARRAGLSPQRADGHDLQPVHEGVPARAGHVGQLPDGIPPRRRCLSPRSAPAPTPPRRVPLPVDAVLFDLDGTLADTAPDLAAALNRVRVDRGLAPLPFARLRPHASHGARGLIGAGVRLRARRCGVRARCATRSSRTTNRRCASTRPCSPASRRCSTRSRRAGCAGASSPTR